MPLQFQSESEMQSWIAQKKIIKKLVRINIDTTVLREFNFGSYIPDIVIVENNGSKISGTDIHNWTIKHSYVSYFSRKLKTFKRDDISNATYSSRKSIDSVIDELIDGGYLCQCGENLEYIGPDNTRDYTVIGLELKLQRWYEAIDQADRYKEFADESAVILAVSESDINKNILNCFKDKEIGLALVDENQIKWVVPKVSNRTDSPFRDHVISVSRS